MLFEETAKQFLLLQSTEEPPYELNIWIFQRSINFLILH